MLALKNWDINLRASEKKTLGSFLTLYALFTLTLLSLAGFVYYGFERDLMLQAHREELFEISNEHIVKLRELHNSFDTNQTYPRDPRYESAIYDSSLKQIFSTLNPLHVNLYEDIYLKANRLYVIKELELYYLGARYLALSIPAPAGWHENMLKTLALYGTLLFAVMVVVGYFLLRLLLRPMREAITLLDRFIKDTTHELNTPINTILSNIELLQMHPLEEGLTKKIERIKIASRTISNLYEDLTYLVLSHRTPSIIAPIALAPLVHERLDYVSLMLEAKKITLTTHILCEPILEADPNKVAKVIDNILSNAIKYNRLGGSIDVVLEERMLSVRDSGVGIAPEVLTRIFERYSRFYDSVGGFGIGLSIVAMIAKEYGWEVSASSVLGEGTTLRIQW